MKPDIEMFKPILQMCKEHIINSKEKMVIEEKKDYDLVTNLDIEVEQILIKNIKQHFPNDMIIAEESSNKSLTINPTWIIDPIDGTVNFSYRSKIYGIQFCRLINKEAVFAVLYLPELDDLYYAIKGKGAYKNGLQIYNNPNHPIEKSIISFGDFSKSSFSSRPTQLKLIDSLKDIALKIRIFGSSCMDFSSLASGQTHAHIMFSKRIWEFSAGLLLLKEAGLHTSKVMIDETNIAAICGAHNPKVLKYIENLILN